MAESLIHPTAIVHPSAVLGEGTRVGAFSIIDHDVTLGRNCEVQDHVVIRNFTRMGDEVKVFPFAVLGADPQHLKFAGEPTVLEVGNRVTIRESVTLHRGTAFDRGVTSVGDDSYIMAYSHVAHDCIVGKGVILANGVQLAGHCVVDDFVIMGGLSGCSQHVRIGRYCYIGGGSIVRKDMPPFLVGKGNEFEVQGINSVGLERRGFSPPTILRLRKLYKIFFVQKLTVAQAVEKAATELGDTDDVKLFLDFVRDSRQGIVR